MTYAITVFQTGEVDGRRCRVDIAHYTTTSTAAEMETAVTELHKTFPAPHFDVEVSTHP